MQSRDQARSAGVWHSEQETVAWGRSLAERARAGDCIALVGEMGAGKTTLCRSLAAGCGVDVAAEFTSPTYTYANEYAAELPVVHMDFYRVADEETAEGLGLVELAARSDALVLIEWAARLPNVVKAGAMWLFLAAERGAAVRHRWRAEGPSELLARLLPVAEP